MKHFGDITKIDGHKVPLVDIITGGSPCQDLSIAGKRAGLEGERSGLFMEQIRIVKEMRNECVKQLQLRGANVDIRLIKPRFMVWENVPGAFSSNKGEDFRCVLEEICRIADKTATVPFPRGGKWSTSGCIMGDGWSVAWRLHDAQFWGVPQRRKRIALVADFGGQSAPEILFERKSVSGNFEKSREQRENASGYLEESADKAISFQERAGKPGGGKGILIQNERTGALSTLNNQSVVYSLGHDIRSAKFTDDEITDPLTATDYKDPIKINAPVKETYQNVTGCLDCGITKGTGNQLANQDMFIANTSVVRRLTPLECERLQGYPDGWTDIGEWIDSKGKRHKDADSPRYKALGNSIALPFWEWMAHRMTAVLKNDGINNPTMASLFDGIGGFPLVYSRCGVKPIWASEVEPFCIAVTKRRFSDENMESNTNK